VEYTEQLTLTAVLLHSYLLESQYNLNCIQ
jgi:hypothetical protein